jgi:hypothetical protein
MALEGEPELNVIAERIKTAAVDKGLNLDDPEYEHTLWCDLIDWMQFSGKYGPDFQAACYDGNNINLAEPILQGGHCATFRC